MINLIYLLHMCSRATRFCSLKMSGSDLDGDQFAITWDSRLFLKINVEPMDFTPAKAPDKNNNINDESLLDHFINHARSSNLGRISMLWIGKK